MVARKKTDIVQLSKIRMREELRAKLARDAERKGVTLNAEIVDRLEQSYANEAQVLRDKAVVDMTTRRLVDLLPPGLLNIQLAAPANFDSSNPKEMLKLAASLMAGNGAPVPKYNVEAEPKEKSGDSDSTAGPTIVTASSVADRAIELAGALRRDLEMLENLEDRVEGETAAGRTIITPAPALATKVKQIITALHRDLEALKETSGQEIVTTLEKEGFE